MVAEEGPVGLPRRRVLAGWLLVVVGAPALTAVLLSTSPEGGLSLESMLFLCLAVAAALVGGLGPALAASVAGVLLLNYWFTEPRHTLTIDSGRNVLTLVVFAATSMAVAAVVDSATRRRHQAHELGVEAATLGMLNRTVLGGEYDVPRLLELVRTTFGADAVELVPEPSTPESIPAGSGVAIAAAGRGRQLRLRRAEPLTAAERRILTAFATHVGVLRDREDLARRAEEARELEAGNRTRTALLAAVSHDLRTPLAGIRSAAETLRLHEGRLDAAERHDLLLALDTSTARLTAMVSDLLDMSRLQTGAVRPIVEEVPLGEVVRAALAGLADAGRVEIGPLPTAHVDSVLLERVVANLVANALRHSATVQVEGEETESRVRLRVVDHGPGVPAADRHRMFEPFQRLGDTRSGAGGTSTGIGLGLAVARGLTEAQGGLLWAEDTPGGGLTMVVELAGDGP